MDAAREAGCNLMTLWLGQDGFDYAFQADYAQLWRDGVDGIREVAEHDPSCLVSLEYKPNEPRSFSLLPDCATTWLALKETGAPNLGVTLDFAHVLYADEQPAFAAALIARHSRLLGLHLNDGYSKRDDGLMVRRSPDPDDRASPTSEERRLRRRDLFGHVSGSHRPRSGEGMRGQHRDGEVDAAGYRKARRRQCAFGRYGAARRGSRSGDRP